MVFSTGCVYPLVPVDGPGSREEDALGPPGEYANSCVGRERVFTHFAKQHGTRALFFRLCYAIDLRYGVLLDVAQKVAQGLPVDVTMGAAHVIWQGDANARAIQCLDRTGLPAGCPDTSPGWSGCRSARWRNVSANSWAVRRSSPAWRVPPHGFGMRSSLMEWFGPPSVSLDDEMIEATAQWLQQRWSYDWEAHAF